MHILICLSYISKDKFRQVKEECNFYERITEFVDFYSNLKTCNVILIQQVKMLK